MADILTTIVCRRTDDMQKMGSTFGYKIPKERTRPVHKFLCEKGVILEVKRASPSKGDIAPNLDSAETARSYAQAGAAAISCLTETNFFKGTLEDLMKVCAAVDSFEKETGRAAPAVLRKDFLINEEEVEIAFCAGADAVLLIARILDSQMLIKMAKAAASHKMTSLVEVRSDDDILKLTELANALNESEKQYIVCGVNSRDLATFKIDLLKPCAMQKKIRKMLGKNARVIFESGIRTPQAANFAGSLGFTGMLLGEAAAKAPELRAELVSSFVNAKSSKNAEFWRTVVEPVETTAEIQKSEGCGTLGELNYNNFRNRPLIKICGLTQAQDVLFADSLGADFVGFIFANGFARNVCGPKFEEIIPSLKNVKAKKVAVITDVNSNEAKIAADFVEKGVLDCLQLHAIDYNQVPKRMLELPHFFAVTEKSGDLEAATEKLFLMGEPRFLQDSKSQNYSEKHKLWLAGGVTPENVSELVQKFAPELIDVSSGVESQLCKKDFSKLEELFKNLSRDSAL